MVAGSNPVTPTKEKPLTNVEISMICERFIFALLVIFSKPKVHFGADLHALGVQIGVQIFD